MIMRNLIFRRNFIQNLFEVSYKFSGQNKVRRDSNIWISKITPGFNQKPTSIIGPQCYGISKRYFFSNHTQSKLRKDDDLQPELKDLSLEGDFDIPQIQDKDIGRKYTVGENVITALKNVYGIERRLALSMMRSQKFLLVADNVILQTIYFLAKKKISPEQIQRIPWLLIYEHEILQRKMDIIIGTNMFKSIEDGLGFCYLPEKRIRILKAFFAFEAKQFPNHLNRLYWMSDMLEVPVAHLTEKIVKPHRIMTMDFKKITAKLDLLKSYNVSNDDILRDLWIFFHNIDKAEERLRVLTEVGCPRPRLWMCRCTDEIFERTVMHYEDKKLILLDGNITVIEWLAEQLECSPEEIKLHCEKNPLLLRIRVSKLRSMMKMLLSEGITREAIRASPRILQHSEKMLKSRIDRLKALEYHPTSCPTLFKSNDKFELFCKNLKEYGDSKEYTTTDRSTGTVKDPWIKANI